MESTAISPAERTSSLGISRRSAWFAPVALTCASSSTHVLSSTGSLAYVAVITTWAPRTHASAVGAAVTSTPNAALARAAKLSRFSGLRLYTRTACARRTVSTASSWVHACVPLPISATVLTSAGASRSVATPVAAPVRIWPRWLASISASGSALAASYSSTWKCIAPRFTLVA